MENSGENEVKTRNEMSCKFVPKGRLPWWKEHPGYEVWNVWYLPNNDNEYFCYFHASLLMSSSRIFLTGRVLLREQKSIFFKEGREGGGDLILL